MGPEVLVRSKTHSGIPRRYAYDQWCGPCHYRQQPRGLRQDLQLRPLIQPRTSARLQLTSAFEQDGADVDYEDYPAFQSGAAEPWLISFTKQLRNNLPSPYIISHAPVAPWFTDDTSLCEILFYVQDAVR